MSTVLKAVHRIEGMDGDGKSIVIEPGTVFVQVSSSEAERLLRLGAATVVEERDMAGPTAELVDKLHADRPPLPTGGRRP